MSKKDSDMVYGLWDKPPIFELILLSLQRLCAIFGATILVPIVVNNTVGEPVLSVPVALIASGLGTLIYVICTRKRSPVYLGSSFAFIAPMIAGFAIGGKSSIFSALMAVGLIYVIISFIIRVTGNEWINKLLPPIIVGPMIMVIGLCLAPTAIQQIGLDKAAISINNITVALVAFLTTAIFAIRGRGILKVTPFLIGIIVSYIIAACLGMVDFTGFYSAHLFEIPKFYMPFVHYTFNPAALLTIVPIALVTIVEHVGDHKVLGEIIGRDLISDPGLNKTLLGDGLATFFAAFIGGPANTTYGENTSVVGLTRVASIYVICLTAIFAILFAFSGHLTALLAAMPKPVIGGVGILLYGFIAVNGIKILIQEKVDFNNNKNIVIVATMLVMGLGGATLSITQGDLSVSISGMALAAITGVVLNLVIPERKDDEST